MALIEDEIEDADKRAAARLAQTPTALAAYYDRRAARVVVELSSGLFVGFRPCDAEGLEKATIKSLNKIEISPSGLGLHFPALDADIYLPALLQGMLGSRRWMAAQLGRKGGRATSRRKAAAVRANGKRGGRPRKAPAALRSTA